VKFETYTVLEEYRGGTYIKQVSALDPESVFEVWVTVLSENDFIASTLNREELMAVTDIMLPVAIEGCSGTWCIST